MKGPSITTRLWPRYMGGSATSGFSQTSNWYSGMAETGPGCIALIEE